MGNSEVDNRCYDCIRMTSRLSKLGFRDTISWSAEGHAYHSNSTGNRVCHDYRNELRWVMAGRTQRVTVYMAHPLAGNFVANRVSAHRWLHFLRSRDCPQLTILTGRLFDRLPVISAPWMGGLVPDGDNPGGRAKVVSDCVAIASTFDEVWAVVGITDGVRREGDVAGTFRDLTHLRLEELDVVR